MIAIMTSRFSIFMALAVLGAACHAEETPMDDAALKNALAQSWDSLIVSTIVSDGCTGPSSSGVRVTRTKTGLSIAKWDGDGSKERVGPAKEFAASSVPDFIDGVLKHYAVARASDDFEEKLAKMKDEKERKAAVEKRNRAAAASRMIGGPFWAGIDIRISMNGAQTSFADRYGGIIECEELMSWLFHQTQ